MPILRIKNKFINFTKSPRILLFLLFQFIFLFFSFLRFISY